MQELTLASDKSSKVTEELKSSPIGASNDNINTVELDEDIVYLSDESLTVHSPGKSGTQTSTTLASQSTQENSPCEPSTSTRSSKNSLTVNIHGSKYVDIEGFPVKKSVYEKLYTYQVEGVKWLLNLYKTASEKKVENYKFYRGCILADDMG